MIRAAFVAALLLSNPALAAPSECAGVREPIIDVHVHAYADGPRLRAREINPLTGKPSAVADGASHRAATISELRRLGVVRALVSGGNRQAAEAMVSAGGARTLFAYQLDDIPTPADLQAIRDLHRAGRIASISEVDPQYEGVAPNDPRLEPLWALAEELDLPVGFHIGGGPADMIRKGSPNHRTAIGNPLLIEEVIARHPKLRLFLMHMGFPFGDATEALMHSYSNVYADLGAIHWAERRPWFHAYLKRMMVAGLGDRIMFGSDQMTSPEAIGQSIDAYREADYLTDAQRRAIFFDNAVRFFRWTDLNACR